MIKIFVSLIVFMASAVAAFANTLVRPNEMGTGALLFESQQPGQFVEAPRLDTDFDISVIGQIARTRVTQRFENPAQGWVEGVYVYPLPEDAAIDSLKMVVGTRVIIGDIKERREAKQIFEQAKAAGQKAALMEQERSNIFTNSIANIGPGEMIVIQIEYQQPVRQTSGVFSLRVPTVVAPRYNPEPQMVHSVAEGGPVMFDLNDPVPDRERITPPVLDPRENQPVNPMTLTVNLKPGFAIGEMKSSYHEVNASGADDARTLELKNPEFANRDFELTWTAKDQAQPTVSVFAETVTGSDYALVQVTPPAVQTEQKPMPRETVFVIDNSGSMSGPSMDQAKASLLTALARLQPTDQFNVIRFDNTMQQVFTETVAATPANVATARTFVAALEANGGTEMLEPLFAALYDPKEGSDERVRQVVFLTDGAIGNEQAMFDLIGAKRGRSRIFMVGIGSAPNSFLMTRMAELGRGAFTQIGDGAQVEQRMQELFQKLENPAVTNLKAVASVGQINVTPSVLPDLYKGEPLTMLVKTAKLEGTLTVSGSVGGKPWTETIALDKAEHGTGVAKLWARRAIEDAEVSVSLNRMPNLVADATILQLALEHHLVSRMTSLVAVDKTPSRQPGERLVRADVPLNLPAGWDFDKVFGEQQPRIEKKAALDLIKVASVKAPAPAENAARTPQIALPQTATPAELFTLIGFGLLILASGLYFRARRLT